MERKLLQSNLMGKITATDQTDRRLLAHDGEIIVYQSSRRLYVCVFTLSKMNISETCGPIATKFYLKHHWVGGKDALGFGPDRIRTLVSMATDSSHRVIMGKML